MAIYLFCAGKNGASALELSRDLEITYKSAWYMVHRIREAMTISPAAGLFKGVVVADETFVGGNPKNLHAHKRAARISQATEKTPVLSIVNKTTGEVRSQVMTSLRLKEVNRVLAQHVDRLSSVLHTDSGPHYITPGRRFSAHETVDHSAGEYVGRNGQSTNAAENHFSQLKRSLDGTYHSVSREHLGRYVGEFDFRASTRRVTDGERTAKAINGAAGKYLSYQNLIKNGPVAQGTRPCPPGRPGPRQAGPLGLAQGSRGTGSVA